ncbi:MAG: hypothetical protein KBI01_08370 [Oscillospiraceae bacterium]|nr:hypothetical protein [Oscillospiraceae bacterium]
MSNSGLRIVWFKLRTENGKKFRLFFPISLNVFRELLDSFDDLITVVCLFTPKTFAPGASVPVRAVKDVTEMLIQLLGSITDDGPYDLVDVSADKVRVSIKIR